MLVRVSGGGGEAALRLVALIAMEAREPRLEAEFLRRFGAQVGRLRRARVPTMSQERLAELSGLHRTEIGKIERGQVEPRLTTLVVLAYALGVPLQALVAGLPAPPPRRKRPRREG